MRVAIIGSRTLTVDNPGAYLPPGTGRNRVGGARGVDACARSYARPRASSSRSSCPTYQTYGRSAPLRRNLQIVQYSDLVLAFWDGKSRGTASVLRHCKRLGVPFKLFLYPFHA